MEGLHRAILVAAALLAAAASAASDRPNVLFIVGDDMGYADVGFHGCRDIPTPHLDALAARSVRCTNGYVSGPYCSPTRAGLLTGRYQTRFGHEFNPGQEGLPLSQATLADRLHAAGYATSLVGKWHLGTRPEQRPLRRGFDEFFGFLGGGHDYFDAQGILRGDGPAGRIDYATDAFGSEAAAFIGRQAADDKPWFLLLAFNAVHTPLQADEGRLAKFAHIADRKRRTYAAMMSAMDDAVGVVMGKLTDVGAERNTLVFFCSDNGGPTMSGTTTNGSRNAPLRGSKRTTLEGGVRVPFLISWPGRLEPGVYDKPVIQLDAAATALAAAGVAAAGLDGVDLVPLLSGAKAGVPHEALYWRFGRQMAIRKGDLKLVRYDRTADVEGGDPADPVTPARLYDLSRDIGESRDLAAEMPDIVRDLEAAWAAWDAANVAPLWGGDHFASSRDPSGPRRRRVGR
jgi:arylsulfatase A-like enzyme